MIPSPEVTAEVRETLVETSSACRTAVDILNDLLLFDKIESSMLIANKSVSNVAELLYDSVKMFSVQMREKKIELTVTNGVEGDEDEKCMSEGSWWLSSAVYTSDYLCVDRNKTIQVVRNLLSNAVKFVAAKTGLIRVGIKFVTKQADAHIASGESSAAFPSIVHGELVVTVTDNGAGISASDQKKLFNQVVQFRPEILQHGGGSGLGLWICKGIVDLHGGKRHITLVYTMYKSFGNLSYLPRFRHDHRLIARRGPRVDL